MKQVFPTSLKKKINSVRCVLFDVDGILTDCRIVMDSTGEWRRFFSIRDGYGIVKLIQAGYEVGIITGSKALDIQERVKVLGIPHFYQGSMDKIPAFEKIVKKLEISEREIAYMGDDDFDLPILNRVGFSATVRDAMDEVVESVHYVARRPAGNGAVREVCELILKYGAKRVK